jgi:DNA end-binding protein Ku
MLNTMRYPDQLRDSEDLSLPAEDLKGVKVTAKEAELAKRLVDDMADHWKPSEFKDTYHQDLMRRIREKIKAGETKEITEPEKTEAAPRTAKVIDLAGLLQQSLEEAQRSGRKAPRRSTSTTTRSTHRSRTKSSAHRKRA